MKIILMKDVEKLGKAGTILKVKDGYARNYLIPRGFALVADEKSVKQLEFNKRLIEKQVNIELAKANEMAQKLAECEVRIAKKVGEEGKLFGSVTGREIGDALKEKGIEIDHKDIILDGNIKKSGIYDVEVKLFREVHGTFKLWVVSEDSNEIVGAETKPVEAPAETEAPAEDTPAEA